MAVMSKCTPGVSVHRDITVGCGYTLVAVHEVQQT